MGALFFDIYKRQIIRLNPSIWCMSITPNYPYSHYIKKMYGITVEDYNRLLGEQRGLCAICMQPETRPNRERLCIDHCHKTGKIRGLLCQKCNSALGYMKDDPATLQRAITYLNNANGLAVKHLDPKDRA